MAEMDENKEENIEESKKGKKEKKSKKNTRAYPSKTSINLLYKEKETGKNLFSIFAFLVFMVLLSVFTKFMVIDQLTKENQAENAYRETERLLQAYIDANAEYSDVEEAYSHYGNDFLLEEELNRQDRVAMMQVIDEKVKVDSGILNIQITYNTATLTIEKTTLAEVSSLVAALEESPIVEYVAPSTAATNNGVREVLEDGTEILDNSVKAVVVIQFKSLTGAVLDAAQESGGNNILKDIADARDRFGSVAEEYGLSDGK